jgi:HCOMODA/2-hydroxy-3-carboxy-muconic semialdehyde decarboxylase
VPAITKEADPYRIGEAVVMRPGHDVAFVACGVMVAHALQAAEQLAKEGIEARVINLHTIKPLDQATLLAAAKETGALVTAEDLVEYDLDGNGVNLNGRSQYSERYIHAEIYRARPDVNAVVHDHSPAVVPFTVSKTPLRAVYHMAAFIGDGLPLFDIRQAAGMTEMLVSNPDRGRALARTLANRPAVLMRGHGVAVVGATLPFAVGRSIYLELNARIQTQALALGTEVTYLHPEESQKVLEAGENRGYDRAWEAWKRRSMTAAP